MPTRTLPRSIAPGATEYVSPPPLVAITATCSGVTGPGIAVIRTVPLNLPPAVGVAVMVMVHEAHPARGPLHPVAVTPGLAVMVTGPVVFPVGFVRVTVATPVAFTSSVPRLTEDLSSWRRVPYPSCLQPVSGRSLTLASAAVSVGTGGTSLGCKLPVEASPFATWIASCVQAGSAAEPTATTIANARWCLITGLLPERGLLPKPPDNPSSDCRSSTSALSAHASASAPSPHPDVNRPTTCDIRCLSHHGRRSVL